MNTMPLWSRGGFNIADGLRFGIALLLAGALHAAAILGMDVPWQDRGIGSSGIDIILAVDAAPTPEAGDAHALAPASESVHPAEQVSDSAPPEVAGAEQGAFQGIAPESVPAQVLEPLPTTISESVPKTVLESLTNSAPEPDQNPPAPDESPTTNQSAVLPSPIHSNRKPGDPPYADLAREIAKAHAQREREAANRAGNRRTKRLTSASTKTAAEAAYLNMWRQKVERLGRANYPPGGLAGELLLLAVIRYDGELREVRILKSSGHSALDDAATRIVRLAAPYSPFPTDMRKSYDQLEIVRRWRFARDGAFL